MSERVGFTEVLIDTTRKVKRIPQSEYLASGQIPVIDQSQEFCAGYYAESNDAFEKVPAIVFGDHTRCVKYVDRPFVAGADGVKVLLCKRKEDNPKYFYYALKAANVPSLGYSRHFKLVKALTFADATRERQEAIVARLDSLEQLIAERHAEIDRLDELVKSRFIEMFGQCNHFVELQSLILPETTISYGIVQPGPEGTGDMGVIRPVDIEGGRLKLDNVKRVDRTIGQAYRRTELTGDEILTIVRGTTGQTVRSILEAAGMNVTRGIAVVRSDSSIVDSDYLVAYMNSDDGRRYIEDNTRGATLQQINIADLKKMPILLPERGEQDTFAAFVSQVDKSEFAVQQAIGQLELLKASLMQEYFG